MKRSLRTPVRRRMTVARFEGLSDEADGLELVRGEVVRLSPGGFPHSLVATQIAIALGNWAHKKKLGRVVTCEAGIVTEETPGTVRGMDVAYVSYARLPRGSKLEGFLRTPPELVVEVVGRGRTWRDLLEKSGEYFRMGVDRVWIAEPVTRRLHVLRADGEPLVPTEKMTLRDEKVLPGFRCRVAQFFRD